MLGSVFVQCRLRPLTFDEVDFSLAVFGGNDLGGVDMGGCRLRAAKGDQLGGDRPAQGRAARRDHRRVVVRTASLAGARVDVPQALAYALAHGLRLDA